MDSVPNDQGKFQCFGRICKKRFFIENLSNFKCILLYGIGPIMIPKLHLKHAYGKVFKFVCRLLYLKVSLNNSLTYIVFSFSLS